MLQAFFAAWVASCDIPVWNSALASIELLLWFWVQGSGAQPVWLLSHGGTEAHLGNQVPR